jgi:RNA polymerase sigma-70 factor (ECF subfamily)
MFTCISSEPFARLEERSYEQKIRKREFCQEVSMFNPMFPFDENFLTQAEAKRKVVYLAGRHPAMKDESSLLKAAKRLDQEALGAIFDLYAPSLYKYGLRLCHDPIEADNIVGDVFAQLLEQLAAGQGPLTNLRSYLYQIAYHCVVNRVRHDRRFTTLEVVTAAPGNLTATSPSTQAKVEERVLMDALVATLNNELTDDQRHVIILRFLEDFSLRETAAIIGKNVNNIKVIQNRAIARLRKSLDLHLDKDEQDQEIEKD